MTLSLVSLQAPQGHLQLNPVYTGVTRGSESQAHTAPTHRRQVQSGPRAPRPALNLCGVCRALAAPPVTLLLLGAESECEGADRNGHCPGHWGYGWTGAQGLQYRKTMVCPQRAWLTGGREQALVLQGLGGAFWGPAGADGHLSPMAGTAWGQEWGSSANTAVASLARHPHSASKCWHCSSAVPRPQPPTLPSLTRSSGSLSKSQASALSRCGLLGLAPER